MKPLNPVQALTLVRSVYGPAPPPTRLHVLGRLLSCPFLRVLKHLPPGSRILDVGAGHGIFAHLALEAGAREVVAVEPDQRKIFWMAPRPGLKVIGGYHHAVSGIFDVVSVFDVLYRFPDSEWGPFFAWVRERLAPGGLFLIKELDPEHRLKYFWDRTQERISDRLGLTLGHAVTYKPRSVVRDRLLAYGFDGFQAVEIGAGYPHAHILYLATSAPR